jgi:glycosyltransferase involved in cell wall biosynthesis
MRPARPLRIVHVAPSYTPIVGGDAHLLCAVSERLATRGHSVTVLTFDARSYRDLRGNGAGLAREEQLNGVRVLRVAPTNRAHRALHWWRDQPGGWRTSASFLGDDLWPLMMPSGLSLLPTLAQLRADVVTSVNWNFGAAFWVCRRRQLRRAPRVAVPILHIELDWARNPLFPRMLRNCAATIVCTDAERDFVVARGARATAVAGAGVDLARFDKPDGARIRARYNLGDRPVVGFVGRQEKEKGVLTLLEAMHWVWEHRPDAALLLAGQSAHRNVAVTDALNALPPHARERIVMVDDFANADAPSILDACDLLALPSVEESFGIVMVEAWACGKPVIGADIAATRCIIEPGVDGFTVPPYDARALADRILDLLSNPTKRRQFGARGRLKVLARYTWDRVTDVWEEALRGAALTDAKRGAARAD